MPAQTANVLALTDRHSATAILNMHRSQWGKMDLMSDVIFNRQLFPYKRNKLENSRNKKY